MSQTFLPGDRVEIFVGAALDSDYMEITVTGLTLATVVELWEERLEVTLDVEPEIPWGGGKGKARWFCYTQEVRAWTPEREAVHLSVDYDS